LTLAQQTPEAPPAEVLLGRPTFAGDLREAASFVRGRRVLLTGAAGSVGTPLAHLLASAGPERLVLLDHHEYSLFNLERSLGASASARYELADIRDRARMERVFEDHAPHIVLHLAAAKHVPYGERFPEGAIGANVLATNALLQMADRAEVGTLVYPSSDKSVQPPSVYGATKRIAEALVQAAAGAQRAWSVVRYVNIIGTRGSVVETFTQQIVEARPLSVTDERMTRYWISMDEAVWSMLVAARGAAPGSVVMPDCGEPVPLLQTARRLAGWYRPSQDPYPIVCTGIRPGERLHEVLLSHSESFGTGPAAGVRLVQTSRDSRALDVLPQLMERLQSQASTGDRQALATTVREAADGLQ
jgi:FlaA1/EpsC-like NDP-sugar epimerase